MYQQTLDDFQNINTNQIKRIEDNAFIPFDLGNTDYQTFKCYLEGKDSQGNPTGITPELKDPEGNYMTQEQIATFLGTLP